MATAYQEEDDHSCSIEDDDGHIFAASGLARGRAAREASGGRAGAHARKAVGRRGSTTARTAVSPVVCVPGAAAELHPSSTAGGWSLGGGGRRLHGGAMPRRAGEDGAAGGGPEPVCGMAGEAVLGREAPMREGQRGYCQAALSCAAEIRRARGPPSKRTKVGVAAKIRRARARRARAPPARFVELQTGELERRRRDPPSSTVAASREEEGGSDRRRGGGVVVGGGAGEEGPPA